MPLESVFSGLSLPQVAWPQLIVYLLLSTVLTGNLATWLREHKGWRDGYARKLNHMGHGLWAALTIGFLPSERLFPTITVATVLVALIYAVSAVVERPTLLRNIVRGSLRDRDAPHGRFFFFLPLVLGNIGIVGAFALFSPEAARAAILVVAIGDGLAEPVGLRFGATTTYRVPDLIFRTSNTKSLAGNAVLVLSSLGVAATVVWGLPPLTAVLTTIGFIVLMTGLEAGSPRGFDNLLLTFIGSAYLNGFLT